MKLNEVNPFTKYMLSQPSMRTAKFGYYYGINTDYTPIRCLNSVHTISSEKDTLLSFCEHLLARATKGIDRRVTTKHPLIGQRIMFFVDGWGEDETTGLKWVCTGTIKAVVVNKQDDWYIQLGYDDGVVFTIDSRELMER